MKKRVRFEGWVLLGAGVWLRSRIWIVLLLAVSQPVLVAQVGVGAGAVGVGGVSLGLQDRVWAVWNDPTQWLRIRSRLFTHYNYRTQSQLTKPNTIAAVKLKDQTTSSFGTLFYHELRIHKAVKKSHSLTIDIRWTQFNILDFDSRTYTYEQDLRYAFHIPMWQGQGNQWYMLSTLSIGQHLIVQFKYSVRNYPYTPSIGSGLNQTRGPVQQVIKAQVLVRW